MNFNEFIKKLIVQTKIAKTRCVVLAILSQVAVDGNMENIDFITLWS